MTTHKSWTWSAPAQEWEKTPLPMRPSGDDLVFRREAVAEWHAARRVPRAMIMGVTPEYLHLPWPEGTQILAVDRSLPMIESVWQGPRENAICADWTAMPLGEASRDIVLCDGGLSMLAYPEGLAMTVHELQRIVAPGGRAIFRLYVPPKAPVTVKQIMDDALAGKVATSMELSILFWGALMDRATASYKVGQSLDAIETAGIPARDLFVRLGWNPDDVDGLEALRNSDMWLYFPTVEQVEAAFSDGFVLEKALVPSYRLGERFPTAILRRKG